ncbi:MAG: trehalose-phosphatase [Nitrospirae bacterium]|nr:trehalose-phosphatase [Nitrospirota bacterium]
MAHLKRVAALVRRARDFSGGLILLLDYDGTLVELQDRPAKARPSERLVCLLRALVETPGIRLVMVSGRSASQLSKMLPIRGLTYFGAYGAQIKRPGRKPAWHPRIRSLRPAIAHLHALLRKDLRRHPELILEDKWGCVGIQARTLPAGRRREVLDMARRRMKIVDQARSLHLTENAYGLEIGARGIDKGWAVSEALLGRNGLERNPLVVYIGDDRSDEPAFKALRREGITIRVGRPRATAARYRLANPDRVLRFLEGMVAAGRSVRAKDHARA